MIREVKLGEICNILNGYAFKSKEYVEDGIRIIRITNVQKGIIQDTDPKYYKIDKIETLKNYMLKENDLLISLTGNVGRVGQISKELLPAGLNQRVGCIRIKEKKDVSIDYLYQYFNSYNFERDCINNSKGIAQKNLSTEWLKNYKMKIPSLDEQKRIAIELRHIQRIKDLKQQQLKELDQLIKSQFVEMFGEVKNSIKLGECCSINARIGWQSLTKKEHMETGEYILVTGTDFRNNEIDYTKCVYVSKERYEMDKKIILKNDDILITKDGTIGKVAVVKNLIKPATLNSGIFVVRPNNIFNKEYIIYVFKGHLFKEFINKAKTGATIKHLNQNKLIKFEIPKPRMEEQIKFSNIYKQIDKQKFEIEKSLKETQELYESLMEKYFG